MADKEISDSEWIFIYGNICDWTERTVQAYGPTVDSLPASDFDLLKQFYPQLNYRELETPFSIEVYLSIYKHIYMYADVYICKYL